MIRHRGTIIALSGEPGNQRNAQVEICSESACAGCHAASTCGFGKPKRKKIQALLPQDHTVCVGDDVTLQLPVKSGFFAVLIVYVIPLMLLLLPLLCLSSVLAEWAVGMISLGILTLWYTVVYVFRRFFERHSVIRIENITEISG